MDTANRETIRLSLRSLAEAYAANTDMMRRTFALLEQELALDPLSYLQTRSLPPDGVTGAPGLTINPSHFSIRYGDKDCFLGNTLPFRFLVCLARRRQGFVSYQDLFADVWDGMERSDDAVRSVAKMLRRKLRAAGMADLAAAIDGRRVPGHYRLAVA